MRIAISGAGIAGPTLAYWLLEAGHAPTLIEEAPQFRAGGYMIDFWGLGYEIAALMGLEEAVRDMGYQVRSLSAVDRRGGTLATLDTDVFARATGGRFTSLPRGDLAALLYGAVETRVETLFGDRIAALDEHGDGVRIGLERGGEREFDLVVGADGLHSGVRRLAFGPESAFDRHLGFGVAAFRLPDYRPREELVYRLYNVPGRQAARFALRDGRTLFLLVFRTGPEIVRSSRSPDAARALLRRLYGGAGWELDRILALLDEAEDFYFDDVTQIRMPAWSKGRVALVGDAAACVSLLAGEGSGLAMLEAYVLAGELATAGGDHGSALRAYEARLRPFIGGKQRAAPGFAGFIAPRTRLGIWLRNQMMRAMHVRPVADWLVRRSLRDDFRLPDYAFGPRAR